MLDGEGAVYVCVCVFQLVYPQNVKLTEKEVSADPLIFLRSL